MKAVSLFSEWALAAWFGVMPEISPALRDAGAATFP